MTQQSPRGAGTGDASGRPSGAERRYLRTRKRFRSRVEFWSDKRAKATTPAERARVAWDHVRARIAELPEDRRPGAWDRLAELLDGLFPESAPTPPPSRPVRSTREVHAVAGGSAGTPTHRRVARDARESRTPDR